MKTKLVEAKPILLNLTIPKMNKTEIVKEISRKCGYKISDVEIIMDEFFSCAKETLIERKRVAISGFGSFVVKNRAPRKAVNPKTKEGVDVPAKDVVRFVPGSSLTL